MNPLTQVKNTQKISAREASAGNLEQGSWHESYKHSAYINIGLLPFELTEGDLLAIFAQYGEVVDVNLIRDKATGKSRGFAFLAYEDQRSTVLAVDNLNGARIVGRTIRVDHVTNYKRKIEEDEEEVQRKREERGVCYAFQRGECNRGDACKYSHDEQRSANTGWGKKDDRPTWDRQRNGRSPPPPPWKQRNGRADAVPSWKSSSAQKDDPPPSRKDIAAHYRPETWDDNREEDARFSRRHDDRIRKVARPSSGTQRTSHVNDISGRLVDNSEPARPSRRYDAMGDDHPEPARPDNGSIGRKRGTIYRDSPADRGHGSRRDGQSPQRRGEAF